jgi:transcriptional regulator with XRE-family HTH domain
MARHPTFGSVIAEARKKKQKSLREIVAHLRKEDGTPITPQYLNDIEHDRRSPSAEILEQIAKIYALERDYLYHLAGTLPKDLRGRRASEEDVLDAWQAFRKTLKD